MVQVSPRAPPSLPTLLQPIRIVQQGLHPHKHRRARCAIQQRQVCRNHGRGTNHRTGKEEETGQKIGGVGADERPEGEGEAR